MPYMVSAALPTVRFDPTQVTPAVEAEIAAALGDVDGVGPSNMASAYAAALESVRRGRDVAFLSSALIRLGFKKRHAAEAARWINDRATALIQRDRQASLGISEAVWQYSGAPCMTNPKAPSSEDLKRDADHKAAHGTRYAVATGALIGGRRLWPGQAPGCKCSSRSVIPGFVG